MSTQQLCILVVDDNKDIRQLVSQLLMTEGYQSITASDGDEMFARLAQTPR